MDLIRRNTDYAIRAMSHLALSHGNGPVSAATIAAEQDISSQLVSKLLQRLQKARLVESSMGARGGFRLSRDPGRITLLEVIEAIQGQITLNRCLGRPKACGRQRVCSVRPRLGAIQETLMETLRQTRLSDLVGEKGTAV
jgi:Rrf2 family iron-sulfur cluster assembly transcriptional regulator